MAEKGLLWTIPVVHTASSHVWKTTDSYDSQPSPVYRELITYEMKDLDNIQIRPRLGFCPEGFREL